MMGIKDLEGRGCGSCRFWQKEEPQHVYGDCHRQPPQFNFSAYFTEDGYYTPKRYKTEISRQRNGVWPNVREDEWCGEYQPPIPLRNPSNTGSSS